MAQVSGRLEMTERDCFVLRGPSGREVPLVWPQGTTSVAGDPTAVTLPDGRVVRSGMALAGGGGYGAPNAASGDPAACGFAADVEIAHLQAERISVITESASP
ncbi:MAG: hypothetical protein ABIW49_01345 [Knoellia sp.]